jgi:hypothetical protein
MDYLHTFGNIPHTPAWYYKQFPGFYNVQCYDILANWEKGCRTPEQVALDTMTMPPPSDRKRKLSDIEIEMTETQFDENKNIDTGMSDSSDRDGLCTELQREHHQGDPVLLHENEGDGQPPHV